MRVRKAKLQDLKAINAIYNQAVDKKFCTAHLEHVPDEERISWFFKHHPEKYPVFVLEEEDQVAGWISLSPYRANRQALIHVAEISYYIHSDHQGKGFGSELLQTAIKKAPSYHFSILIAILLDKNRASIGILEKFSFREWGRMPGIAKIGEETADHLYYGLKL